MIFIFYTFLLSISFLTIMIVPEITMVLRIYCFTLSPVAVFYPVFEVFRSVMGAQYLFTIDGQPPSVWIPYPPFLSSFELTDIIFKYESLLSLVFVCTAIFLYLNCLISVFLKLFNKENMFGFGRLMIIEFIISITFSVSFLFISFCII